MGILDIFKDVKRKNNVKARDFAQELSYQFMQSPICSDYENLFAQIRPLVDAMKMVKPYGVGKNGAKLPYKRTPELELLDNPNDEMGWAEFADAMFCAWLSETELDIHVHWNKNGTIGAYTILPPQSRIYLGYGNWEWQVMTTDGMEVLTEADVMRLRFSRSPRDLQRGVSPASAVRVWAQIDDLISQYQKAYFENGAIPATITFITASTEEKYRRTRDELEHKLRGAKNRNKTVYAWRQFNNDTGESADQIEVKTIQGSNSTLAIKDIVAIINDRLNKSVGVSNFILGDDSSAKYDNAELSDHQFTKRRVYPALVSFWNQFQHELERVLGTGLGYGISFDLAIPELTERKKALAEIHRIESETLVNLISAGASSASVVKALGLGDDWQAVADGIYTNKLSGDLMSPVSIDYEKPKQVEATVDKAEKCEKKDAIKHKCTCKHSLDELPPMTKDEKMAYELLVELANAVKDDKEVDIDQVIDDMYSLLEADAKYGAVDGAKALQLLADEDVAGEIAKLITKGDVYFSKSLAEKLRNRADMLVRGYHDYTKQVVSEVLNSTKGMTANEIKEKLSEVLPESRAELIARNETVYAIKSGRLEQDQELANKYGLKLDLIWRTSHDSKVCDVCAAMDGQVVPLGDAFTAVETQDGQTWDATSWNDYGMIPDAHPNCVLGDTIVSADNVKAATKMNYSGDIVKLKTRSGKVLSVTPNHILLTQRGWVAAKNIQKTDKVVAYSDRVENAMGDNTIDGNQTTIADEFVSLEKASGVVAVEVPVTAKDFKGDAVTDEKVKVILPQSFLRNKANASLSELPCYLPLVGGKLADSTLSGFSSIDQLLVGVLLATNGIVGSECKSLSLLGSGGGHSDIHRFTSSTAYNARLNEAKSNSSTADIETLRKSFLTNAGLIEFDDVISVEIDTVHNTPVYDLETTSTLYTANGIISSNCRCYFDERLSK